MKRVWRPSFQFLRDYYKKISISLEADFHKNVNLKNFQFQKLRRQSNFQSNTQVLEKAQTITPRTSKMIMNNPKIRKKELKNTNT